MTVSRADLEAAFEWWRLAGLDHPIADEASLWLAPAPPAAAPGQARQRTGAPGSRASLAAHGPRAGAREASVGSGPAQPTAPIAQPVAPDPFGGETPSDLASFRRWWLEAPGIDAIGPRGRIAPVGSREAPLMVLVVDPEESDRERLLSGPQGRLLDAILAAIGHARGEVYLASALPRHTPMPDIAAIEQQGMGRVLRHHIALAAPRRLLAFGTGLLPLLGHGASQQASGILEINQENRKVPFLVSQGLDNLMAMPRLKARFWRDWLEWTEKTG